MPPDFIACSGLIIDDIVLPDGRTHFNTLGGSATHGIAGMRVWTESLGYFAAVGDDLDPTHRDLLERIGVDLRGLIVRAGHRTPRAWQLFEPDERRIEVFRTDVDDFYQMEPSLAELPADYLEARGFHLCHGTTAEMTETARHVRARNPNVCIAWEPTPLQVSATEEEMRAALAEVDFISPDLAEAREMTGRATEEDAIATLLDWGARLIALRLGARGSRVIMPNGPAIEVPAVPATVIDTTGGGDAYCGGFLVALADRHGPGEAGARAAVSASFAIEQFGIPTFGAEPRQEAERRLAWARERIGSEAPAGHDATARDPERTPLESW
jgi:ribokinase